MWDLILSAHSFAFVSQCCILTSVSEELDLCRLWVQARTKEASSFSAEPVYRWSDWRRIKDWEVVLGLHHCWVGTREEVKCIVLKQNMWFCLWLWFEYNKADVPCFAHELLCTYYSLRQTSLPCHHTQVLRSMKSSLLLQGTFVLVHASSSPSLSSRAIFTFSLFRLLLPLLLQLLTLSLCLHPSSPSVLSWSCREIVDYRILLLPFSPIYLT